jgi:hypothetical protein
MRSEPSADDVERIVAIKNPVIRNLEITYSYSRLAAACAERHGQGANWCTELRELLARFEPVPPARDDCGARDWSDLHQRMHYIVHLFRAFHLSEQLFEPPFNAAQVASISRGVIPEGEL